MKRTTKVLRKIGVAAVGFPLLILGIILIPLPGPGILVSFLGLFVLSLEFDWVKPYMERAKRELEKIKAKATERQDNINQKQDRSKKS
jgi:uncharacterized protein (TIGR02611 family)